MHNKCTIEYIEFLNKIFHTLILQNQGANTYIRYSVVYFLILPFVKIFIKYATKLNRISSSMRIGIRQQVKGGVL